MLTLDTGSSFSAHIVVNDFNSLTNHLQLYHNAGIFVLKRHSNDSREGDLVSDRLTASDGICGDGPLFEELS